MRAGEQGATAGLAAALSRITDGVSRLVSEHLALARVELKEDARAFGVASARIAVFVPLILVGYGFLCGAVAVLLASWIGLGWALFAVGLSNVVVGGLGALAGVRRLQGKQMLDETRVEVSRSAQVLSAAGRPRGTERRLEA